MNIREIFFLSKESISPAVKYIKELDKDKYEVHEHKKSSIIIYTFEVIDNEIQIIKEREVPPLRCELMQ